MAPACDLGAIEAEIQGERKKRARNGLLKFLVESQLSSI